MVIAMLNLLLHSYIQIKFIKGEYYARAHSLR